jgi:hypothetical protein
VNTREAKFILQAYRPGGEDANDPQFAEALEQAKRDPELARWFAEQLAFDAAASRALKEVKVPAQLRETILVGQRVIKPVFWWKRPAWWALAASIVVLVVLSGLWFRSGRTNTFANYIKVISVATQPAAGHLDIQTKDPQVIRAWLAGHDSLTNFTMPAAFRAVPAMGCRVLSWHSHKVSMLCYMLEGSKHVDVFVAMSSDFPDPPANGELRFRRQGSLTIASWTQTTVTYVVISPEDEQFLRTYIGSVDSTPSQAL